MGKNTMKSMLTWVTASLLSLGLLAGCGSSQTGKNVEQAPAKETAGTEKTKDASGQNVSVKVGLSSYNASYLPLFIAEKKGLFQKYHVTATFTKVQGGVTSLRGLQTGDFQIISSLPESVITGVVEGANIKLIGTLDSQSMYSIYTTPDIKNVQDLKGKKVATNRPGNGTDIQLRWWLKKNGVDPDKDVRIIEAGENSGRLQALISGQAQMTILSQPTDLKADEAGMKRMSLLRDQLKTYNHNMLVANNDFLKNQPEAAKNFMGAFAEAVAFAKDPKNREENIQILMEKLEMKKDDAAKSLDFVLPALADKGKINIEGVKWAIETTKEAGVLKNDIGLDQLVDESYYAK
jgi:NitT/TauT family transport system substrate-binding protein